jgi:hypothetical protein
VKYLYLEIVVVPRADGTYQAAEAENDGLPKLDLYPEDGSESAVWGFGDTPQEAVIHLMEILKDEDLFAVDSEGDKDKQS